MRATIAVLGPFALIALAGCGDGAPAPDTTLYGHVVVVASPGRGSLVLLENGSSRTEVFINDRTKFSNMTKRGGKTLSWSFDHVHRVEGVLNWAPDELLTKFGCLNTIRVSGVEEWIWATRVERLSAEDSAALLGAGTVSPRDTRPWMGGPPKD